VLKFSNSIIPAYFFLIFGVTSIARLLGGGFGMTALTNAAMAILVFAYLALASYQITKTKGLRIDKAASIPFLLLLVLIASGFLVGFVSGNKKIYLISTTIYWSNVLLFGVVISSVDCTKFDLERLTKWIAYFAIISAIAGFGVDNAIAVFLFSMLAIYSIGVKNIYLSIICLAPFAIKFNSMNRGGILALLACMVAGSIIYRRSKALTALLGFAVVFILAFPSLDVSKIVGQKTNLHRRLTEVQMLMSGQQKLEEMVALQQRFFEMQLVEIELTEMSSLQKFLGGGFGKTLDMTASSDASVKGASTLGADAVHNVHSLPHSIVLRSGVLGLLYLFSTLTLATLNLIKAARAPTVSPLLAFCILFPIGTTLSALPAANYYLTEFFYLGSLVLAARLLRELPRASSTEKNFLTRKRIVWQSN